MGGVGHRGGACILGGGASIGVDPGVQAHKWKRRQSLTDGNEMALTFYPIPLPIFPISHTGHQEPAEISSKS